MAKKSNGLTQTDINKAVYTDREYYIRDTEIRQLFYRVKKGNKFSWVVGWVNFFPAFSVNYSPAVTIVWQGQISTGVWVIFIPALTGCAPEGNTE